jgi:cytochrome c oxidase assembly factor CtaG
MTGFASLPSTVLRWTFEPSVVVPIAATAAWYLGAIAHVRRRRPSTRWRTEEMWFLAGLGVLVIALCSPLDAFADDSLAVHMVQHLLLTLVAPPLLLLGRPITLLHAAAPRRTGEAVTRFSRSGVGRVVGSPVFGFASFSILLWASHLTPLYEATLENDAVHAAEHAAYVFTACLFWWPVVGRDPGARRLSYPARLLYLFLAMPVMSLLGFVVTYADRVLYPHYVVASRSVAAALADQHLGGAIMWESSMLTGAFALSVVLFAWFRHDDAEARRTDVLSGRPVEVPGG